jgi:hypothetical protein
MDPLCCTCFRVKKFVDSNSALIHGIALVHSQQNFRETIHSNFKILRLLVTCFTKSCKNYGIIVHWRFMSHTASRSGLRSRWNITLCISRYYVAPKLPKITLIYLHRIGNLYAWTDLCMSFSVHTFTSIYRSHFNECNAIDLPREYAKLSNVYVVLVESDPNYLLGRLKYICWYISVLRNLSTFAAH